MMKTFGSKTASERWELQQELLTLVEKLGKEEEYKEQIESGSMSDLTTLYNDLSGMIS